MTIINEKVNVNANQIADILNYHTQRRGLLIDLDRVLDYQIHFIEKAMKLKKPLDALAGVNNFNVNSSKDVLNTLVQRFNVSEHKLMSAGKLSANKIIINNLMEDAQISDDVKLFLKVYQERKDAVGSVSRLEQYVNLPLLEAEDFQGHRVVVARPHWHVLDTSRLSAREPSIQNIAKIFADLITHLEGQTMVRSDSGQIEPRITYSYFIRDELIVALINLYNDAYFGQLHYVMMSDEEDAYYRNHLDELEVKEWDTNLRKDLKTLGLAGNYGSSNLGNINSELAIRYEQRIQNHPGRIKLVNDITKSVKTGQEIFYSAFGTPVEPTENSKYTKGTIAWQNHLIRCGLNNPIQTTAADLMCEAIYRADKILKEEARGDSWIGYAKHDEGLFYLDRCDAHLVEPLRECFGYDVTLNGQKWVNIDSDILIGVKPGMEGVRSV